MRFHVAHETHVGLVRAENEDAVAIHPAGGLWAVADGMGGHRHGRFASDAIVARLCAADPGGGFDAAVEAVRQAIAAANAQVAARARAEATTIGSTVAALVVAQGRAACLWAGDSRIYRFRNDELTRLTNDHTLARRMRESGRDVEENATHVLTRAVGVEDRLDLDEATSEALDGDVFLLCSDGVTGCLDDREIAAALRRAGPRGAAPALLQACLARGAPDNVTLALVACEDER